MPDPFVIHMVRRGPQDFLRNLSKGYAYAFYQSRTLNSWSQIAESQGNKIMVPQDCGRTKFRFLFD